jgi:hypothetical protein
MLRVAVFAALVLKRLTRYPRFEHRLPSGGEPCAFEEREIERAVAGRGSVRLGQLLNDQVGAMAVFAPIAP